MNNKWVTKTSDSRLSQTNVPIIGLTGGIATGKSTVSSFFRAKGLLVIDADLLVKKIYTYDKTFTFIQKIAPSVILEGEINFPLLRALVFSTPEIKTNIENYIYAHLPNEFVGEVKRHPESETIIYDAPLLFERGLDLLVDQSICVYSPMNTQIERLTKRDHIEVTLAQNIISKQLDIETKKDKANFIIHNTGDRDQLELEFQKIFNQLFN